MNLPDELKYFSCDEVAECLDVSRALGAVLWGFMSEAAANGAKPYTGETPPEPDHSSRQAVSLARFWSRLDALQQAEIIDAAQRDGMF
jgi:hypothetical protein